jgi:hypothetical protein
VNCAPRVLATIPISRAATPADPSHYHCLPMNVPTLP